MTPFFSPGPIEHPKVPIFIAGVNPYVRGSPASSATASTSTRSTLFAICASACSPTSKPALAKAGRTRRALELSTQAFLAIGDTREEIAEQREKVRQQISFYASTRAYQPVLDAHGWGDLSARLGRLAAQGEWSKMPARGERRNARRLFGERSRRVRSAPRSKTAMPVSSTASPHTSLR